MTSNSIVSRIFDPQQANASRPRFSLVRRVPLVRPNLQALYQGASTLPRFVQECPVAMRYLRLLGPLSWARFPERDLRTNWGAPTMPYAPFVAACLVKLDQRLAYMSHLRQYLVEHPALAWVLGFPLVPASRYAWGFDVNASLPTQRHLARLLRRIPNASLQFLLDDTVYLLRDELWPVCKGFGRAISLDTKHILAWVRQNNLKDYVKDRFDKRRQPKGDPDCRLGCKRRRNQRASSKAPPPTPADNPVPADTISVGEYHWGYASGIVATKVPGWGEFALAELTQPFDCSDVSYFFPLMADTERRLGFQPPFGALDAAYDAWYVYEYFDQAGGFAAVPLVHKGGHRQRSFDAQGLPLCEAGLSMPLKQTFLSRTSSLIEHEKGRYVCPLLFPEPNGKACPAKHRNWQKGGCKTTLATSIGARIRYQLDRGGEAYTELYKQRTASERIFAQAVDLGIERPKLRNGAAITNQNTLIYVLLNLRALQRVRQQKLNRRLES